MKVKKEKATLTSVSASERKEQERRNAGKTDESGSSCVRILPLGGLDRIGMNCTLFEYEDDMIIVDAGIAFPQEDMPGVEVIIPDFSYIQEHADKLRGLVLTHGHEDHIGAVPFLLEKVPCDVYGTRLTLGIVQGKLEEHDLSSDCLYEVRAGEVLTLGAFEVELIHVNHSMPDSVGLCISTPCGRIVMTGDFKIDYTPIGTTPIDLPRFAELGKKGVRLLMADSTNVERPGFTPSERTLTASFDRIFSESNKRIIFSTFASNVHRVQQILEASRKWGRKVAVTGRSMENVLSAAESLGYIEIPEGLMVDISDVKYFLPEELTILTTGTQGEPMSALYRMAFGVHSQITLNDRDVVILSSSCIPGNERFVNRIINELYRRNITVITDRTDDVHVSGHACREELKLIHELVHADNFVPVHGEYRHLAQHAQLARDLGTDPAHVLIPESGRVIQLDKKGIRYGEIVSMTPVLIDSSLGSGVESAVLTERKKMAEAGVLVAFCVVDRESEELFVDLVTKGFIFEKDNEELMEYLHDRAARAAQKALNRGDGDVRQVETRLKDDLSSAVYEKTKRKPQIVPRVLFLN